MLPPPPLPSPRALSGAPPSECDRVEDYSRARLDHRCPVLSVSAVSRCDVWASVARPLSAIGSRIEAGLCCAAQNPKYVKWPHNRLQDEGDICSRVSCLSRGRNTITHKRNGRTAHGRGRQQKITIRGKEQRGAPGQGPNPAHRHRLRAVHTHTHTTHTHTHGLLLRCRRSR